MTIADWLADAPDRTEAEWVLEHVLGLRRFQLPLADPVPTAALPLAARLAAGEPLQYVLGDTNFYGLTINCDPRALIPRPETEELVTLALDDIPSEISREPSPLPFAVVDVGTGTGCIALAIKSERPHCSVTGIDVSEEALALARSNAERTGLEVSFVAGDLLSDPPVTGLDLVVSNLPYIGSDEIPELDANVRDHEPHLALDGGPDGLDLIRLLVPQAAALLRPNGRLLLEIGERQGPAVAALLEQTGFVQVEVKKDIAGHDRFVIGSAPKPTRQEDPAADIVAEHN